MGNPEVPMTYWQSLAAAADRGELFLDPEVAAICSKSCTNYVAKLQESIASAKLLAGIDGWGEFQSGQALREIYAKKAVGGENNMVDVLQSHIDVVTEMQAVFKKFFVDTTVTDVGTAADIGQQIPK
ncbi:hypothetical protein QMK17_22185 [Rhodococcus sp. G-MC3]|uniref:hypothetical protein n=1 Tax=Rhodococcus sp. G-MC3 TaxID=3046209 RepID=UPI0024BB5249|nr:hypothetical protein [Rhodococcus sp. G-MC3]MDJ0396035.1 hypothetical protein [Rhodococcus sp. G-MC3]